MPPGMRYSCIPSKDLLEISFQRRTCHEYVLFTLQAWLLGLSLVVAAPALAGDIHKHGGAYYIYLPATVDFAQVVSRLQTEIQTKNWDVLKVQDIEGLKENYQMDIQNKVVYACKSQHLAWGHQGRSKYHPYRPLPLCRASGGCQRKGLGRKAGQGGENNRWHLGPGG